MTEELRILFRDIAGRPPAEREDYYNRHDVPTSLRQELESLLAFDETRSNTLTAAVGLAAGRFLAAPSATHRRCGPYRLTRLIGNGGMGAVYLAERDDGEIEQRVAVKLLHPNAVGSSLRDRFLRERQILASLNHAGIARLLDAGHHEGHPYLVMEYVEGVPIDRYCRDLDHRSVIALFLKMAEAVAYAHRNLVIHRDLKPSNILVTPAGHPKLLDFGIAKLLDTTDLTRTVERALTPEYASPEQFRGSANATTTDVYSLGAVLFRLLTGQNAKITNPDLPSDLAAILSKAMRPEPEERYPSVDLLCDDLQAFLDHRPVKAKRGNSLYLIRKFARRRWLPLTAALAASLSIGAGLLVANHERAKAERRFQQVRQLSHRMLDLDGQLRDLTGATKTRMTIVSASLEYLERLRADTLPSRWGAATKDRELALEIGAAYLRVARVQGVPVNSNLGQFAEARKSLDKAASLLDSVLADSAFPRRSEALFTAAEITHDAMILAESENRHDESIQFAATTASRLAEFLALPGNKPADFASAGRLFANLALANNNMHRLADATRFARRFAEVARLAQDPLLLTRSLSMLSNTARAAGDLDAALSSAHQARTLAEKLVNPAKSVTLFNLCSLLWREGLVLGELNNLNLDRPRDAEPLLLRAFDIAESLARKDPDDYASRSHVSMTGRELGDFLRDRNPARALAVYDHTFRRLSEIPNNTKARLDTIWVLAGSSYALRSLGRPADARKRIDAALQVLRELRTFPAPTVELGAEADTAIRALADHYAATGDLAAAIRTYEDLLTRIQAAKPLPLTDIRHANNISRVYRDLAGLYIRAHRSSDAAALDQRRSSLWQHWDRLLPGNSFVQRQLAALQSSPTRARSTGTRSPAESSSPRG